MINLLFEKFSGKVTKATGKPLAFIFALLIIIGWVVTGPIFHYSDTWQLVINTGTTIITFLMVFVIQQSQNKDTVALHLKLNELIAASSSASNRLVDVEDLSTEELETIKNSMSNFPSWPKKKMIFIPLIQSMKLKISIIRKESVISDKIRKVKSFKNRQVDSAFSLNSSRFSYF